MAGIALSGLASGVDTSSIVAQLMAVERQKTTTLTNRQTKAQAEQDALKSVVSKLTALQTAADAFKKSGTAFATSQTVEAVTTLVRDLSEGVRSVSKAKAA